MRSSPVVHSVLTQSDSFSKPSHSGRNSCDSEIQLDTVDELQSDKSSFKECNLGDETGNFGLCTESNTYSSRFQLEQDVNRLQQQLQEEMELHAVLEKAIEKNAMKLSSPSHLPHQAQELLSNIALLEVTVSKLEQDMVSLHFQLSQERNERRLAEYRLRHSSFPSIPRCSSDILNKLISPSLRCSKHSISIVGDAREDNSSQELQDQPLESTDKYEESMIENGVDAVVLYHNKKMSMKIDSKSVQAVEFRKLPKGMPTKGLWDHPNQLSEEMMKCMKNIFISLADSAIPSKSSASESHCSPLSPRGHLSNLSWWSSSERSMISSWVQSPQVDVKSNSEVLASENACDPYRVRGKLSWADIGNYGLATEVSWMSVGKKQLEYAAGALRRFRTLVEQLAKVNPIHLSCDEKLAFWINLYNALIMHAYLAYGVPRSDLKLFSLMQKAAYTVGGHSFSAAAIEYVILKMKPPLHRPQIALLLALHKLKVSDEQLKSTVDIYEPLVTFALSCGMYSSPAVRIYTAKNVTEELQEAQRDFIRASVGVSSKGRLLVPKMLHCFAKGFVDDANLAVWISHYLPPHQAAFVEQCISKRRQSLLGSRNCGILPFDSCFRYLFLPDKIPV
ncbi:uncharacterized protein LOC115991543 isoform X2 [Quercus lobata]|uniref:Uncharacterized protein n=1 Tax=Quercus lobata TaxID=97700 RepID=A0A7N2LTQ2_QUELO|nr:uncharacterized protein LOC115991543 isoform X1 [Quercus lobata]XP_030971162.1 uncharacterized protein LOC115991543 isoform X1 [Quercus lobata]XP_030971163.1 uncharacterized protein LOC115991543 isoform X1 [Quercus lobata]XP_030971165.1 uncharacterized protein LOC115991543 isoform X1 [Quercus lobata]XP_030971166.1 uncharacterized protein LOC115991543 isoform X2 [Quercus lobata]XP_030971167.1 uncharacterized protein LOC115991543 isoform X2 [Quercus lobata]XP_030971168.1 uncharacterized prot